ncbi:hypothetical protein NRA35_02880, partial [Acinetobacter baumannii]|nr:hypothetical protein [Acinetobacter baumannii]
DVCGLYDDFYSFWVDVVVVRVCIIDEILWCVVWCFFFFFLLKMTTQTKIYPVNLVGRLGCEKETVKIPTSG